MQAEGWLKQCRQLFLQSSTGAGNTFNQINGKNKQTKTEVVPTERRRGSSTQFV